MPSKTNWKHVLWAHKSLSLYPWAPHSVNLKMEKCLHSWFGVQRGGDPFVYVLITDCTFLNWVLLAGFCDTQLPLTSNENFFKLCFSARHRATELHSSESVFMRLCSHASLVWRFSDNWRGTLPNIRIHIQYAIPMVHTINWERWWRWHWAPRGIIWVYTYIFCFSAENTTIE